jgi:hypothetical protein
MKTTRQSTRIKPGKTIDMKTNLYKKAWLAFLQILILLVMICLNGFTQQNQNSAGKQQEQRQSLTPEQTATVKKILSKYQASTLSASDARAIHEQFRMAGIHDGPETKDAIKAAGFDPDKLRSLDPPPAAKDQEKQKSQGMDEKLKSLETNILGPLSLNASQKESVINAYKEFYTGVDNIKKTEGNAQTPVDKSKTEPLKQKRDETIKKVLTSDQYKKYLDLEKASHSAQKSNQPPVKK